MADLKRGYSLFSEVKRQVGLSEDDVEQGLGVLTKQIDSLGKLSAIRPSSEAEMGLATLMTCRTSLNDIMRPVENQLSALTEENAVSSVRPR